jgi:hypothetical protein
MAAQFIYSEENEDQMAKEIAGGIMNDVLQNSVSNLVSSSHYPSTALYFSLPKGQSRQTWPRWPLLGSMATVGSW